jgi:DNA-binding response OmpR family regulator
MFPMSHRKRILCVEDNQDARGMLEMLLRTSNLEAVSAANHDEAVRAIEKEEFDLCIIDSVIPGVSGLNLCEEIRSKYPEAPIIIYSGRSAKEDREAGLRMGANAYVVKPEIDQLIATIRRFLPKP